MPDLSDITAQFDGSEWQTALAAVLRQGEQERIAGARLLHDETGPLLSAVGLQLKVLALDFPDAGENLHARVAEIQQMLNRAIESVRSLSRTLNPSCERTGLRSALERLAADSRRHGCDVTLECADSPIPADASLALAPISAAVLDYARKRGARKARLRLCQSTLRWIVEVLYDESNLKRADEPKVTDRPGLIGLCCLSMRFGVPLEFEIGRSGETVIRATYPAA